ncbi:MAG: RICIN domain-containing protein [Streptosporangiaceae bacterium]|nr:RICIN domain-containing protein [Streptosporangiaceae bacterium]
MHIKLPTSRRHRDGARRHPRRAARLSAARLWATLAVLATPAVAGAVLAGPASASSSFTTHLTPNNTFFLLLDVSGGSTYPGAPVIDWTANGGANQDWLFQPSGGSNSYQIVNVNSNMCLTTDGAAGDQVFQDPCTGAANQQWLTSLSPGNGRAYTIQSAFSGLYLDVSGDSPWEGTAIDTWPYNGGYNQQFGGV